MSFQLMETLHLLYNRLWAHQDKFINSKIELSFGAFHKLRHVILKTYSTPYLLRRRTQHKA